ncbi:hypothetical protein [Gluconobacter potus]|uniref:hypothetical protein n=1 Tax=Gluconobacter potus TaxID=2724927 RepID=UPI000AF16446|nr:hypothetical protein [Gluconobacter potus]
MPDIEVPTPSEILDRLVKALDERDGLAVKSLVELHHRTRNEQPLASCQLSDWRIEDASSLEEADTSELRETMKSPARVTVREAGCGIVVSTTPPGARYKQEVTLEFDKGSLVIRPYLEDVCDEPLAVMQIDDRGAHLSRPYFNSQAYMAAPPAPETEWGGRFEPAGEWKAAEAPPPSPAGPRP